MHGCIQTLQSFWRTQRGWEGGEQPLEIFRYFIFLLGMTCQSAPIYTNLTFLKSPFPRVVCPDAPVYRPRAAPPSLWRLHVCSALSLVSPMYCLTRHVCLPLLELNPTPCVAVSYGHTGAWSTVRLHPQGAGKNLPKGQVHPHHASQVPLRVAIWENYFAMDSPTERGGEKQEARTAGDNGQLRRSVAFSFVRRSLGCAHLPPRGRPPRRV